MDRRQQRHVLIEGGELVATVFGDQDRSAARLRPGLYTMSLRDDLSAASVTPAPAQAEAMSASLMRSATRNATSSWKRERPQGHVVGQGVAVEHDDARGLRRWVMSRFVDE